MERFLNGHEGTTLCAYSVEPENALKYILFLSGGSKTIGKDRFKEWQDSMGFEGVGSVSFDFSGVGKSSGNLREQSLSKRIDEAMFVTEWVQKNVANASIILYGASMGGYVALALTHKFPEVFKQLILQVPAAYSSKAHILNFDESFTNELRRSGSWKDSYSFAWYKQYTGDKLLIASEKDDVIPREIIDGYKIIGEKSQNFSFLNISGAPHNIFNVQENSELYLKEAYSAIVKFISRSN